MILLGQSAFLKALGWALLNSLWQFSLMWLVFVLFVKSRKNLTPAVKHGIALVLITAGFIWFAASLSFQYFAYADKVDTISAGYVFGNDSYASINRTISNFLEGNLPYLSAFYLVIVAALFVRFFRYFYYSHRIQTRGLIKLRAELRLYVQQLVQQLGIRRKVSVWISEYIDTPMIIGFLKPTILIPVASINQLSVKQLEAILLHELAHIKRNDYLINLYVATTEILFFFNPFTKLLIGSIKQEREKSCDDWVIQFRFNPHQYASALLKLEQCRSAVYSTAIAATGESTKFLLQRVQRIMGLSKSQPENGFKLFAYFFTLGFLGLIVFVNPGDLVMKKLVNNFYVANDHIALISKETGGSITSLPKQKQAVNTRKNGAIKKASSKRYGIHHFHDTAGGKFSSEDNSLIFDVSNSLANLNQLAAGLSNTLNREDRDFSIPENPQPILPAAASVDELPFVPNSSFSYFMEDTTKPRIKKQNYYESAAHEAMIQAQKAVEKIDWKKIQIELKNSKADVVKVRNEIQKSLQQLNWQQINKEVKDSLNKEATEKMRSSLYKEYQDMNNYRIRQRQYEQIKTQLQQQEEQYKRDAEIQLMDIQKTLQKKRVVVYI